MIPPRIIPKAAVVNDRYEVQGLLGAHGTLEMILALDRAKGQEVVLEIASYLDDEAKLAWAKDAEAWVSLAQRVRHPNVCHVHGLEWSPWGPLVVTEYVAGPSLHTTVRRREAEGGMTADELRSIGTDLLRGLAAIHDEGVIHGDIKPGKMRIAEGRAVIHSFWSARRAEVAAMRPPGAPPEGGTPSYMSPERLRHGGASFEDDVYALALTLWEALTCRVPELGYDPRARRMKQQLKREGSAALLTTGELRQLFQALHPDPSMRPKASQMRFGAAAHGELLALDEEDRLFAEWTRA